MKPEVLSSQPVNNNHLKSTATANGNTNTINIHVDAHTDALAAAHATIARLCCTIETLTKVIEQLQRHLGTSITIQQHGHHNKATATIINEFCVTIPKPAKVKQSKRAVYLEAENALLREQLATLEQPLQNPLEAN